MVGKTVRISGFPIYVTANEVKVFLERYVDEGAVDAVKVRLPKGRDRSLRAFALVQFSSIRHAGEISSLAQQKCLMYGTYILNTLSAEHDIVQKPRISLFTLEDAMLHLGCPISSDKFSVLRSFKSVRVDFGFNLRKIYFFIPWLSKSYKLELSYEAIWEIKLLRFPDKHEKFLLIQVCLCKLYHVRSLFLTYWQTHDLKFSCS